MEESMLVRMREQIEILTGERGGPGKPKSALRRDELSALENAVAGQGKNAGNMSREIKQITAQIQELTVGKLGVNAKAADSSRLDGYLAHELRQVPYCAVGGTANALLLQPVGAIGSTIEPGDQYRFRAALPNNGASTITIVGLAAKEVRTVTGAATPAGYLRADTDTLVTYDQPNDCFIATREAEAGAGFTRYADGVIEFSAVVSIPEMDVSATAQVDWPLGFSVISPVPVGMLMLTTADDPPSLLGANVISSNSVVRFFVRNGAVAQPGAIAAKVSARWY